MPPLEEVKANLVAGFAAVVEPLKGAELPPAVYDKMAELGQAYTTDEELHKRRAE